MSAFLELSGEQWTEIVERLTHHAACRIMRHTWRGLRLSEGGAIPGGIDPADLAAEAITDVLEGKRNWNRLQDPDLLQYLLSVVDSKVSHLVREIENRVTTRLGGRDKVGTSAFDAEDRSSNPTNEVMDREEFENTRNAIIQELSGDNIAIGILDCLESGITKPSDMAILLEVTVKDVNNAQKRLRRKAEGILKSTQNQRR